MIQDFVRVPIEVEAVQWTGDNPTEVNLWAEATIFVAYGTRYGQIVEFYGYVDGRFKWTNIKVGDWIVREQGIYTCYTNEDFQKRFVNRDSDKGRKITESIQEILGT